MDAAQPNNTAYDAAVDDSNPWLGLASFTEDTRAYFHGREEEVAELARRVQRKLLTVLFGQSGLGKTSILRAGLVPRLRDQGYCPVYVRIDYAQGTPEPSEQIKQAIRTASETGEWSQAGIARDGESLWEFLHHRDDVLRDTAGNTLMPLLIFDQFEEIFTLAQGDEFGRARAARFIEDLADLVENRAPKALEARLEADESAAERFDFARGDYRVLIALREDYLAPLESLKTSMPSVSQNRLRLAPMTGRQALAAILGPGRHLVSQEVAEAIVRFVAGGAEIANAEVEPSLLSLICRELNDARLAAGRREITQDLLAGSHTTILSKFYERALADQPAAVRRIVEDDLLTDSGFRENVAEEKLLGRFAAAGAAPGTLALLVNRRLLRVEERLDIRRVELTHDVLCGVVKTSRDQRHERETHEATERLLAEQGAREKAARGALVRARQIAAACTVLAVVAIAAALFALFSQQRARRAEQLAQETRRQTEQARGQAEQLLGYLSDDFGRELESFGELQVMAEFAQRQIDYFHGLPPQLKSPQTLLNGALALVHHAEAMRLVGDAERALADSREALGLLQPRLDAGDHSQATALALALAYTQLATLLDNRDDPTGPDNSQRALTLLQPLAQAKDAPLRVRMAYADVLFRRGWELTSTAPSDSVQTFQQARQITEQSGALDLSSLDAAAVHADIDGFLSAALQTDGRIPEARAAAQAGLELARRVLQQRPGNRQALHAEQNAAIDLVTIAIEGLDPEAAFEPGARTLEVSHIQIGLEPHNIITLYNMGGAYSNIAMANWNAGRLREAVEIQHSALGVFDDMLGDNNSTIGGVGRSDALLWQAEFLARLGDIKGLLALATVDDGLLARHRAPQSATDEPYRQSAHQYLQALIAEMRGDPATARRLATAASARLSDSNRKDLRIQGIVSPYLLDELAARMAYRMGDFPAAERADSAAIEELKLVGSDPMNERGMQSLTALKVMAQARQGHTTGAAAVIRPVVTYERGLAARNRSDRWVPYELALALYAEGLADPSRAAADLAEAARLVDSLAPQIRALRRTQELHDWINAARKT